MVVHTVTYVLRSLLTTLSLSLSLSPSLPPSITELEKRLKTRAERQDLIQRNILPGELTCVYVHMHNIMCEYVCVCIKFDFESV